jgi:hypothetical protein
MANADMRASTREISTDPRRGSFTEANVCWITRIKPSVDKSLRALTSRDSMRHPAVPNSGIQNDNNLDKSYRKFTTVSAEIPLLFSAIFRCPGIADRQPRFPPHTISPPLSVPQWCNRSIRLNEQHAKVRAHRQPWDYSNLGDDGQPEKNPGPHGTGLAKMWCGLTLSKIEGFDVHLIFDVGMVRK